MNAARRNGAVWMGVVAASLGCSSASTSPAGAGDGGSRDAGHTPVADVGTYDAREAHDAGVPDVATTTKDAPGAIEAGATPDAPASIADAGSIDRVPLLGACVGASMPILVAFQTPYATLQVGTETGAFALDFGSTFSSIDLTAFASPGPSTSGCDPSDLGETCTVADFSFFGPPSSVALVTEDYSDLGGSPRQAGILGTDFLSEHVITLDYTASTVYAAPSSTFCAASALEAAGFVPLSTAGYYENDLSLLDPATDVDSSDSSEDSVPNVPTVPVSIAGTPAIAQLDTGFDDDVTPFSVNINQAFYSAIVAANAAALVRDASLDESLSTCTGGTESVKGYRLASGVSFAFVQTSGSAARSYAQAVIFVKDTPASAASCGGIGTWTVPAAQVGASFYLDMQGLAFDPFGAKVWVPVQ